MYRKRGNNDVVVALDDFAREHIAVFFDDSACHFQGCVEHRIEDKSAVRFDVEPCAFGRGKQISALDVQTRRVGVACRNVESKIFADDKRDYRSAVFDDVVLAADFEIPFVRKVKF